MRFTIFCEKNAKSTCSENAAKFQNAREPMTLIHMDNVNVHTARPPKRNWIFPDSNARGSHRIARILHHLTFLFGWLATQLGRGEYNGEDELCALYELVDEILTYLSIKMIETVFINWMNRLQRLIDGNGHYAS
jgi:hypothetical protein